jgi:hypothetical protein
MLVLLAWMAQQTMCSRDCAGRSSYTVTAYLLQSSQLTAQKVGLPGHLLSFRSIGNNNALIRIYATSERHRGHLWRYY